VVAAVAAEVAALLGLMELVGSAAAEEGLTGCSGE
jgi:hypothetical protein